MRHKEGRRHKKGRGTSREEGRRTRKEEGTRREGGKQRCIWDGETGVLCIHDVVIVYMNKPPLKKRTNTIPVTFVSELSLFLRLPVCRRSSFLT
jgi:hypothetical protein